MTIERLERLPVNADRLAKLRELFPEVFADGRLNVHALAALLEGQAADLAAGAEHYGLDWPGKQAARQQAGRPPTATLRPAPGEGVNEDLTQNHLIIGDNLEVLRVLQKSYAGRVKVIYIDPPYNTGNDFIYKDDFKDPVDTFLQASGQADLAGLLTSNPKSSGRFHSRWLSFMYPRLALARSLLASAGFLVVSIDDGEVHNLRLLLDSVFGPENFIANIVWQKAYVANMTAKFISATHDHILVYAKSAAETAVGRVPRSEEQVAKFDNPDGDPRGPWKAENLSAGKYYAAGQFAIVTPAGRSVSPPPGRYWRCSEARYKEWLRQGRITFGKSGDGRPMLKKYLSDVQAGLTPETWWRHQESGTNKEATLELKRVFGGTQVFDTPKPVRLLKRILALFGDPESLVLDFFAGSGTTGQAVFELNREDHGRRRFILVQVPEPTQRQDFPTIADITRARLRAATTALPREGEPRQSTDEGFRVLYEAQSSVQRWRPYVGNDPAALVDLLRVRDGLVAGWKAADLLIEIMLLEGFPLDSTRAQSPAFRENVVYLVEHASTPGRLFVCLDDELSDQTIAQLRHCTEAVFVCRESALTDTLKVRITDSLYRVRTL